MRFALRTTSSHLRFRAPLGSTRIGLPVVSCNVYFSTVERCDNQPAATEYVKRFQAQSRFMHAGCSVETASNIANSAVHSERELANHQGQSGKRNILLCHATDGPILSKTSSLADPIVSFHHKACSPPVYMQVYVCICTSTISRKLVVFGVAQEKLSIT